MLTALKCPSDLGPSQLSVDPAQSFGLVLQGTSSYLGNFGIGTPVRNVYKTAGYAATDMQPHHVQGIFGENSRTRVQDVRDGLSNVIYVAERRMPQDCSLDFAGNTTSGVALNISNPNLVTVPSIQGAYCGVWGGLSTDAAAKLSGILYTAATGDPTTATVFRKAGDLVNVTPAALAKAGTNNANGVLAPNVLHAPSGVPASTKYAGENQVLNTIGASSWHAGGIQAVLGDGTVRFFTENVDSNIWINLNRKSDGRSLGAF